MSIQMYCNEPTKSLKNPLLRPQSDEDGLRVITVVSQQCPNTLWYVSRPVGRGSKFCAHHEIIAQGEAHQKRDLVDM